MSKAKAIRGIFDKHGVFIENKYVRDILMEEGIYVTTGDVSNARRSYKKGKVSEEITKSQMIRDLFNEHGDTITGKEIVDTLAKDGINVTPQLVSNVRRGTKKVNKSQMVRDIFDDHGDTITTKEIVDTLAKDGITITTNQVYKIRRDYLFKGVDHTTNVWNGEVKLRNLHRMKEIISQFGGMEKFLRVFDEYKKLIL